MQPIANRAPTKPSIPYPMTLRLIAHLRTEFWSRHPRPQAIRLQLSLHVTVKGDQILPLSNPDTLLGCLVRCKGGRLRFGVLVSAVEGRTRPLEDFGAHCVDELKMSSQKKAEGEEGRDIQVQHAARSRFCLARQIALIRQISRCGGRRFPLGLEEESERFVVITRCERTHGRECMEVARDVGHYAAFVGSLYVTEI